MKTEAQTHCLVDKRTTYIANPDDFTAFLFPFLLFTFVNAIHIPTFFRKDFPFLFLHKFNLSRFNLALKPNGTHPKRFKPSQDSVEPEAFKAVFILSSLRVLLDARQQLQRRKMRRIRVICVTKYMREGKKKKRCQKHRFV